jgi:hypothetical protein
MLAWLGATREGSSAEGGEEGGGAGNEELRRWLGVRHGVGKASLPRSSCFVH